MTPPRPPGPRLSRRVFHRLTGIERRHVAEVLRAETVGGGLLIGFAVAALVWANSPWSAGYRTFIGTEIGPHLWHLHLSVGEWAADFLLAFFFLVAGIELKHELQVGDLSDLREAVLPIVSAVCGMVLPVAVYLLVSAGEPHAGSGWAIPTATDIAFALAVLAVMGRNLPSALRAFLLTLAVVDDLGAIVVIATVYTEKIDFVALAVGAVLLVALYVLQRLRVRSWWVYAPLGLAIWIAIHSSGVHATVAGVAIGLILRGVRDPEEGHSPGEATEHTLRPFSAGFCVPMFALTSAGVSLAGGTLSHVFTDRIPLAVAAGLFVGKFLGVFGGAYLTARFTRAELSDALEWRDIAAVSILAGVGFTVSLLISELAFDDDEHLLNLAKGGVLFGSLLSAAVAAWALKRRDRFYDQLCTDEESDPA